MDSNPATDRILVAREGATAHVRVIGRGSFKAGPALKKFGLAEIENGCRCIILDMKECLGMDSTFMGILAGLALTIQRRNQGMIQAVNLSGKNFALLETLGLSRLIQTCGDKECSKQAVSEGPHDVSPLVTAGANKTATTQAMLAAHEALVAISPDNMLKFKDVLRYLREELHQGDHPPAEAKE